MNDIPKRQNDETQLRRLLAQRRLYSQAKAVLGWQIVLTVPAVVAWSLLGVWVPQSKLYAGIWGLVVSILDVVALTPWQSSLKRKAAGIQEAFDCDVLELEWPDLKAGRRPDEETVVQWSKLPVGQDYVSLKLRDWYRPEVGEAPINIARLICQRTNCWWDAQLRRRFAGWVISAVAVLSLSVITVAAAGHVPFDVFILSGLVPVLPAFMLGLRIFIEQRQAASRLDALKTHSETLWELAMQGAVSPSEAHRHSRALQNEILDQRTRSPLLFDWVYCRLRDAHEDVMNRTAQDLLREARTALRF